MLRPWPEGLTRADALDYYTRRPNEKLFEVKPVKLVLPEEAKIFDSYVCECCGEQTGANWIRIENGKKLCLDCSHEYRRFSV